MIIAPEIDFAVLVACNRGWQGIAAWKTRQAVKALIGSFLIFFFQAEDGIRVRTVTGVQTCALPISHAKPRPIAKKPSPAVSAAAASEDAQAQLSTLALPPVAGSVTNEADSDLSGGSTAGNGGEGAGGSGSKTGVAPGGGSGHGSAGGISARPEYGLNPKPPYPLVARRLGAQGVVVLRVQVCEDGRVAAVELAHSSGFALLDESASRTVRQSWRFVPARLNGAPVASWVEVPIQFVLRGSSTP